MQFANAREIIQHLKGTWHGNFGMACCPAHRDRSPSLSIAQGRIGPLLKCHAGCAFPDIMRALRRRGLDIASNDAEAPPEAPASTYSLEIIERLWHTSLPIAGTLAERYLARRGLPTNALPLRFRPNCTYGPVRDPKRRGPALLVPLHDDRQLVGLQRIFLDPADRQHHGLFKPLLTSDRTAAIRLRPATDTLALAESFEDALAYGALHEAPTWGLPGAEHLAQVRVPAHVTRLIVAFDNDRPGRAAFDRHAGRHAAPGRTIEFHPPPTGGDWNNHLNSVNSPRRPGALQ